MARGPRGAGAGVRAANDEAQAVGAALGSRGQLEFSKVDCLAYLVLEQGSYPAKLAHVRAQFESSGFALHPLEGESLVVSRWGMYRVLQNLTAAEQMLQSIGGPNG